ncbi:MAG: squalene synthase HpnC [Ignavibacteria bacterium]|nr:MAG: squalene synthase HpnC [Ignavibacteria bacterium]
MWQSLRIFTVMTLHDAYESCQRLARRHYENFPVASRLMPARLRPHVAAVYAFARHADDFADEGDASGEERRAQLEDWRAQLDACVSEEAENPVFLALGDTIRRFDIPLQLFHDLLDAFVQDTWKERYATFDDVLDYCRRSANPVGRIVLALFGRLNDENAAPSDALCTGLQLANFWQDVSVDRLKPRVYIPVEDLERYGSSVEEVLEGKDSNALRTAIAFQVQRTEEYFRAAVPLFARVPFRLRLELRAIWYGGMRILEKIEKQEYTTIVLRPTLSSKDVLAIVTRVAFTGGPFAGPH